MKALPVLFFSLFFSTLLRAQTLDKGREDYYYQRYRSAEIAFHNILMTDPANAEAWAMLMRTYIKEGKDKEASDSFTLVPGSIKDQPYYHIAAGVLSLSSNSLPMAKDHFEQAVAMTKGKNTAVLAAIAEANIESPNGDNLYAIALVEKAIKRDKKNSSLYCAKGRAYHNLHNGTEAYKALVHAIEINSHETIAFYELGKLFLSQKNKELYPGYFTKAIESDRRFSPAFYAMYSHFLYLDPSKAKDYFLQYLNNADPSLQQAYSYTDLLYLTRNYDSAILRAQQLIRDEGDKIQPRLYKLISYSYQEKKDTVKALDYMARYFEKEADSNRVMKDYETIGVLYNATEGKADSAIFYFKKALALAIDDPTRLDYYQRLAMLSKKVNNNADEAYWLGQSYSIDPHASNVTLFNWGVAAYKAQDFKQADSVFVLYSTKYPDQGFGYYWRARSNAALDSGMKQGLAVPHYEKLIEVISSDTLSNTDKKWLKEAYGYLASYEANTEKDYAEAISYFEKLLEMDPSNEVVAQNIKILEKNLATRNKEENDGK